MYIWPAALTLMFKRDTLLSERNGKNFTSSFKYSTGELPEFSVENSSEPGRNLKTPDRKSPLPSTSVAVHVAKEFDCRPQVCLASPGVY